MRKKLVALGVLGVALSAPGTFATASHGSVDCRLLNFAEPNTTGQDVFEGAATGYVVGNPGEAVSVRCVARVNGAVRGATSWGSGTSSATTSDRMTYVATETEVVQLCAQYTTSHGFRETCFDTINVTVPPQEVVDAFNDITEPVGCVEVESTGTCRLPRVRIDPR